MDTQNRKPRNMSKMQIPILEQTTPKRDEKMTCKDNTCEYKPTLTRLATHRTPEEIQYGKLWAQIELPKQLKEVKTNE